MHRKIAPNYSDHALAMASHVYGGAAIGFEGGLRAGSVSVPETLPSHRAPLKKLGYDEHRRSQPIQGEPTPDEDSAPTSNAEEIAEASDHGYSCSHGCGAMLKSSHGLARHIFSKHGGFRGLGRGLTKASK